jgi:hypothetical protein
MPVFFANLQCQIGNLQVSALNRPDLRRVMSASDRDCPLITGVNDPLMARICSPDLRERARPAWLVCSARPGPMVTG